MLVLLFGCVAQLITTLLLTGLMTGVRIKDTLKFQESASTFAMMLMVNLSIGFTLLSLVSGITFWAAPVVTIIGLIHLSRVRRMIKDKNPRFDAGGPFYIHVSGIILMVSLMRFLSL